MFGSVGNDHTTPPPPPCYNSPEPLLDEIINPSDQVVNVNSSETSNLDNMTNEVPPQDINDANKNK